MNEKMKTRVKQTFSLEKGSWKLLSNRTNKTVAEVARAIGRAVVSEGNVELLAELGGLSAWLEKELEEHTNSIAITKANIAAQTPVIDHVTPPDYIKQVLTRRGITISDAGNSFTRKVSAKQQVNMTSDDILTVLYADLYGHNLGRPTAQKLKEGEIKNQLFFSLLNGAHRTQAKMGEALEYVEGGEQVLNKWLKDLHSLLRIREPLPVWNMLMKHMMWLIKRNVYSAEVKNDIWLQIMGKQGTGKSYVARKVLFSPINDFYIETELSKIDDIDREVAKFTSNFVVNFDEVAIGNTNDPQHKVGKKMLNNLKAILTRDVITVRTYHSQKQENRKKTFTAFSSANTHLYDVIFDETGMRRFFEFNSDQPKDDQYNHDEVARLGGLSLEAWKAVDENIVEGYWSKGSDEGRYIFKAQESYFPTYSTVAMWVKDAEVGAGTTTLEDAYTDYQDYCRTSGNSFVSTKQGFIVDIRHICKGLINETGGLTIGYKED